MNPELAVKDKLNSDTIFTFINEAIDKFYKTRYSEFEQNQKRIDDLRSLVKIKMFSTKDLNITKDGSIYQVELPEEYAFLLGDTAGILPDDDYEDPCWETDEYGNYVVKRADSIETTIENIDRQLNNSLSEHLLKYSTARPLRLIQDNKIFLYTDGKYKVDEYKLTFLSKPVFLNSNNITNTEYVSLPEHTHMEIVKMAVQLYLATKPMEHYSVYSAEVNNME